MTTPLSNHVCLWQLQDLEQTIADASPEELPKLHAKLLALSTGLTEAATTYAEQVATSQKAIWEREARINEVEYSVTQLESSEEYAVRRIAQLSTEEGDL